MTESQKAVQVDGAGAATRNRRGDIARTLVRLAFFAVAVALGFILLEVPWNDGLPAMEAKYVMPNLAVLALGGAIVFLIGQRTRASLAVFVSLCLLSGMANFFLIEFKGQPIVPADLFALSTAASVSSGYSLFLTSRLRRLLRGARPLVPQAPRHRARRDGELLVRRAARDGGRHAVRSRLH